MLRLLIAADQNLSRKHKKRPGRARQKKQLPAASLRQNVLQVPRLALNVLGVRADAGHLRRLAPPS
ncbi:hypothetical protein HMPREF3198_01362 [Winkia neuii]|nr:hypothetical protein HMPREF3198_01362 [Winkia neuii]